jgi:2'-hydroxyisoflavone reductase
MSEMTRRRFVQSAAMIGSGLALSGCALGGGARGAATRPQKILILGGTSFLGPELVRHAQARGHTLTLFNRGKTNPGLFPELEKLHGDRTKPGGLKLLEGRQWDAVIDTSGYVPRVVKASAELLAPNVEQYVFVSTISVYPDDVKPGADESAPVQKIDDPASEEVQKYYGALKALCEQAAEAALPGRVTNVRPGLIVGPGDPTDRFSYWPVRMARGGEVLAPGSGEDPAQVIDVRDLAAWIILTVERRGMGVYNAVGPSKRMTMRELLEGCRAGTGSDASIVWADAEFLEQQKVSPWMDMPVWTGTDPGFATIDNRKVIKAGATFRPIEETARDTWAWFQTLPPERRSKLRAGLQAERETQVLAAWKEQQRVAG